MFRDDDKNMTPRQEWRPSRFLQVLYLIWRAVFAVFKIAAGAAVTVLLIALVCAFVFAGMLGDYLENDILPQAGLDLSNLTLDLNSTIYYIDSDGQIQIQQKIDSSVNRDWAEYEDIPQDMIHAAIAIEDHRFYHHQGVDWVTTIQACARMFFGDASVGGSSITQQLVKNTFGNTSVTVQRKVLEIFQATEMEKQYDKETILEYYLNVIYLGQSCSGVRSAARAYYGKELEKLTAAECASIIGITNSPTYYDPYQNWENNARRTQVILTAMRDQGWLTEAQYQEEIARERKLKWGVDFEDTMAYCKNEECGYKDIVSTLTFEDDKYYCPNCGNEIPVKEASGGYNYHTETVIMDVAQALAEKDGLEWNDSIVGTYLEKIKKGGYSIYSTMDLDVQHQVEKIYYDLEQMPDYRGGMQLQSAIVVIDNITGDIVGIAGGFGPKTEIFGQNRATKSLRQSGSSIKPIAIYAPAFEEGLISPLTTIKDLPLTYDGGYFPRNDNWVYNYSRTILSGVTSSVNAIAAHTLEKLTTDVGYDYAKNKFGLSTLIDSYTNSYGTHFTDNGYAPLAMGAQTWGVTVRDMASAFATFANDGVYRQGRTYTQVFDSEGNLVLDNPQVSREILGDKAVNYMNYCLVNATQYGTGTEANLAWSHGITTAGKTGTTADNYDRWYCGFTGHYTAAVWTGFDYPAEIRLVYGGNPAAQLFKKVMGPLHYGKRDISLYSTYGMQYVEVCLDSGLRATDACRSDVRDSDRVSGAWVYYEDIPSGYCTKHTTVSYCSGGGVATEYCAKFAEVDTSVTVSDKALLKLTKSEIDEIKKAFYIGLSSTYKGDEYVYLVDARGNDAVFNGFNNNLNQAVSAPYVICSEHTQQAWEEYERNHPVVPDIPSPSVPGTDVPNPNQPTPDTPSNG